jgi:hypothetical protein
VVIGAGCAGVSEGRETMRTCAVCKKTIRRDEPFFRGYANRGPSKHLACVTDRPIDYTHAEEALLLALRELKRARSQIRGHRWREANPMILKAIDRCTLAIKHVAFWEAQS